MDYQKHDLQVNDLFVYQSDEFFKFGTDAIELANFARAKRRDRVLDIGTGTGIIPIMLAGKFGVSKVYGIEVQQALVDMAKATVRDNGLDSIVDIICTPVQSMPRHIIESGQITLVTVNPPYATVGSGDMTINYSKAISRFELTLTLEETVKAARGVLGTGGRLCMVHKTRRLAEVVYYCKAHNLEPKRLKFVAGDLFVIECICDAASGLIIER